MTLREELEQYLSGTSFPSADAILRIVERHQRRET